MTWLRASPLKVLLVEDSETDVLIAVVALSTKQFRVHNIQRLTDAFKKLSEEEFDAILLDLGLPDSEGLETLREFAPVQFPGPSDRGADRQG